MLVKHAWFTNSLMEKNLSYKTMHEVNDLIFYQKKQSWNSLSFFVSYPKHLVRIPRERLLSQLGYTFFFFFNGMLCNVSACKCACSRPSPL